MQEKDKKQLDLKVPGTDEHVEGGRLGIPPALKWMVFGFTIVGLILLIDNTFFLGATMKLSGSPVFLLYAEVGIFGGISFILFPYKKGAGVRWFDLALCLLTIVTYVYLAFASYDSIVTYKWMWMTAPMLPTIASFVALAVVFEATRRCAGLALTIIAMIFGWYPLFAQWMPGPFNGMHFGLIDTAKFHVLDLQSVVGIAMNTIVFNVLGFMFFAAALMALGAGQFFIDLSFALLGHLKGGPAYVSVLSSSAVGTMTGSPTTNILVTGSFTIPAMKKAGYRPSFAAAVEAVSGNGGIIMPPVMGTCAFLMASFLGITYSEVILRATIPAILYYVAIFTSVYVRASSDNLKGIPREQIPSATKTLRRGWLYLAIIAILIYFIFYLRVLGQAPLYAVAVLLVAAFLRKETRPTLKSLREVIDTSARMMSQILVMVAAVGLIIGSFSMTGVGNSLARELVMLAHGNSVLLLVVAGIAAFLLGTGLPALPVYIFMVIVLVPSLTTVGFIPFASHLFIVYLSLFSAFTPPVALAAFVAAPLAGARYVDTCIDCIKIAASTYLLPFVFVLDSSMLLFGGNVFDIVKVVFFFAVGVILMHAGIDGYIFYFKKILVGQRILYAIAGVLVILPVTSLLVAGVALTAITIVWSVLLKNRQRARVGGATAGG